MQFATSRQTPIGRYPAVAGITASIPCQLYPVKTVYYIPPKPTKRNIFVLYGDVCMWHSLKVVILHSLKVFHHILTKLPKIKKIWLRFVVASSSFFTKKKFWCFFVVFCSNIKLFFRYSRV